jgi:hypothetical protein
MKRKISRICLVEAYLLKGRDMSPETVFDRRRFPALEVVETTHGLVLDNGAGPSFVPWSNVKGYDFELVDDGLEVPAPAPTVAATPSAKARA